MQIEKNDLARALEIVRLRDKDQYDKVLYRKDRVNKPGDLLFIPGEIEENIIRNVLPDFDRYAYVGVKGAACPGFDSNRSYRWFDPSSE